MVIIGRHRLHIDSVGQGGPTVILESGRATCRSTRRPCGRRSRRPRASVTTTGRVLAGSRQAPNLADPQRIARELHPLLDEAGINRPLRIDGAVLRGPYLDLRTPASQEVEGMVLVGASHPLCGPASRGSRGDAQTAQLAGNAITF